MPTVFFVFKTSLVSSEQKLGMVFHCVDYLYTVFVLKHLKDAHAK